MTITEWKIVEKSTTNDIDRTVLLINWVSDFILQIKQANQDNKISWFEKVSIAMKAVSGIEVIMNIKEIATELSNLNSNEIDELSKLLANKFNTNTNSDKINELITWINSFVNFALLTYNLIKQ